MDLRRLSHVVALADTLHFARAAEQVHLSQPAFSRSIQAIEDDLGTRLFDRETGEVRPTPAGVFVIERARRLLFEARCLQRDVGLYVDSQLGDTAFGVGPVPSATLMPRVLPELRRRHSQVALRVEVGNWVQLLERLRSENIEFFVADVRDMPNDPALDIQPIGRQPGHLFVRAGHPLARQDCTFEDAWRYGVAATKLPSKVRSDLGLLLKLASREQSGQDSALMLECDDMSVLRAVALSTDTVLAVTDASVQADVDAGRLVALRIAAWPSMAATMGVVRLRNRTPSPMARTTIACIEKVAGEINVPS